MKQSEEGRQSLLNLLEDQRRTEANLQRRTVHLMTLNEISRAVASTLDLDRILQILLESVRHATRAEACSAALVDPTDGGLVFRQAMGQAAGAVVGFKLGPGQGIAGWVAQQRQSALVADASSDPRFYGHLDNGSGFVTRNLACVPLIAHDNVIGVLELINKQNGGFTSEDLQLLESVAGHAALAVENARLFEETRRHLQGISIISEVAMAGAAGQPFDETVEQATQALRHLWPQA